MSYNIGSANWATTKDSVIARITSNDPDIFCAVEAGPNKRLFLESSLPNYRLLQTFSSAANLCESHLFLRNNMFLVADSGYVQMPTYMGYTGMGRYLNWAKLQTNITQQEFIIYGSHFLAPIGANADSALLGQYRHADAMIQQMSLHANLNIPQITVGDFNAGLSTNLMQYLINQTPITFNGATITNPIELEDSWVVANPSTAKPATTFAGSSAIDWILTTPNTTVMSAIIDGQGVAGGMPPSDHKPLQIIIDISTTSSIDETSESKSLKVYPNPANHSFNIVSNGNHIQFIKVINTLGEIVLTKEAIDSVSTTIDLSHLKADMYYLQINLAHQTEMMKIIIE
jgi:endonuclease/exonuclease/phosphatase family metal-dependent hydrolase